ncbi:MAG: hypothetical protein A2V88_01630 [Elusimicrobia bacterium RBG_16_66_12]|nr:MAG: hypothetical protein A2V88_01630 [Elusimicrobia bacterium RBG_16_66_12]
MNRTTAVAVALLCVLPAAAQAPAASDADVFALALHRRVAGGANVMTSPYSLRQALGMAYVGAAGQTRAEMARVLGAGPAFESDEKERRKSLEAANGPATLKVANALFLKEGYALLPLFIQTVRESFAADVFVRKFGPEAVAEINAWARKATNGKIPAILGELAEDDRAVLLNAVYFKGSWVTAFPKEKAGSVKRGRRSSGGPFPETFHPTKGKPFPVELMSVHESFAYAEAPGWQAVRLPYKGGRLAMIAVLPAADSSMASFRENLDAPVWRSLRSELLMPRQGLVAIPRFTFAETYEMKAPLGQLGMNLPFDRVRADFSKMSKPGDVREELYISKVVQKTFVAVDEEGTEAAAVTSVLMGVRGASMRRDEPFRFVANRPFLFVIEEVRSGTILFIGEVHDPR